jgi:hypothetical protein
MIKAEGRCPVMVASEASGLLEVIKEISWL